MADERGAPKGSWGTDGVWRPDGAVAPARSMGDLSGGELWDIVKPFQRPRSSDPNPDLAANEAAAAIERAKDHHIQELIPFDMAAALKRLGIGSGGPSIGAGPKDLVAPKLDATEMFAKLKRLGLEESDIAKAVLGKHIPLGTSTAKADYEELLAANRPTAVTRTRRQALDDTLGEFYANMASGSDPRRALMGATGAVGRGREREQGKLDARRKESMAEGLLGLGFGREDFNNLTARNTEINAQAAKMADVLKIPIQEARKIAVAGLDIQGKNLDMAGRTDISNRNTAMEMLKMKNASATAQGGISQALKKQQLQAEMIDLARAGKLDPRSGAYQVMVGKPEKVEGPKADAIFVELAQGFSKEFEGKADPFVIQQAVALMATGTFTMAQGRKHITDSIALAKKSKP